jgi:hypothetical protein
MQSVWVRWSTDCFATLAYMKELGMSSRKLRFYPLLKENVTPVTPTVSSDAYIRRTIGMIIFFRGVAIKERALSLMRAPRLPLAG